jgi:hypothetical protein
LQPIDYANPRSLATEPARREWFDRRVTITLIVCGTLVMIAPWMLAIVAVLRGGEVTGSFWQVPFVWMNFFAGGFFVLIAVLKAPRSGKRIS